MRRAALIIGGYAAAWAAGAAAVWWSHRNLSATDQLAMSGMLAFGDTVRFFAVAAPLAIVPTVVLFRQIGNVPWFWRAHAIASLLLALTGIAEAFLLVVPIRSQIGFVETLRYLSPLRVLAAPVFLLAYTPGLLRAAAPNRKFTVTACLLELCTMASFVAWVLVRRSA
jgi:hypothetical protein